MTAPVVLYRPAVHNQFRHICYLMFIWACMAAIASSCVFYALGYEVNWAAHTIRQTSIISLDSYQGLPGTSIMLNGTKVAASFPVRLNHLFPGRFTLEVTAPGYQGWSHQIDIAPNAVINFRSVVLLAQEPVRQELDANAVTFPKEFASSGIDLRQNELWVDGKFVTRTSDDILAAQRFPDGQHLVYQQGGTLWLCDLDGFGTERIATGTGTLPLHFLFQRGGQRLVYQDPDGRLYSQKLY